MTDPAPAVGRAATPAPPNQGSSSLGRVLGIQPRLASQSPLTVLGLCTAEGRSLLRSFNVEVFPAVPGLFAESMDLMRPAACILEAPALNRGPWAGCLSDSAPDLADQIRTAISRAVEGNIPVYWVDAQHLPPSDLIPSDAVLPVVPGSVLYDGVEEGAPASRVVRALRALSDSTLHSVCPEVNRHTAAGT